MTSTSTRPVEEYTPTAEDVAQVAPHATSTRTIVVHKAGEEGIVLIDAFSYNVIVGQQDKPEWAEGLLVASAVERFGWYNLRLGADLAARFCPPQPEAIDMQDLAWTALDSEGAMVEIEADAQFRSDKLQGILMELGIVAASADGLDEFVAKGNGWVSEGEDFDLDARRTDEQVSALDKAQADGWGRIAEDPEVKQRTGTHG